MIFAIVKYGMFLWALTQCRLIITWDRSRSTFAHVTACYMTAPSHNLDQCWLAIIGIHSSGVSPKLCNICCQNHSKLNCLRFNSSVRGQCVNYGQYFNFIIHVPYAMMWYIGPRETESLWYSSGCVNVTFYFWCTLKWKCRWSDCFAVIVGSVICHIDNSWCPNND